MPLNIIRTPRPLALAAAAAIGLGGLVTPATASSTHRGGQKSCAKAAPGTTGATTKLTFASGGRERTYLLHLPRDYPKKGTWPLILAFHGRGSTATELEGYSKLSQLDAVVVYPDGAPGSDADQRQAWQGAPYARQGVDDVAFTQELLISLQHDLCVSPERTYATGKSNGAGFSALLACRLPDRFAAVAPVAGAFYPGTREGCVPGARVPLLDVHGTGDSTIPYAGDERRGLPAIPDFVAEWARRNGCAPRGTQNPVTKKATSEVSRTRWKGCTADVEHLAVTEGGHVWPGADTYSGGGHVTQTIEMHEEIGRFFAKHSLTERSQ